MKTKLLRRLSVLGLILAALASLDLTGFTAMTCFPSILIEGPIV